MAVSARGRVVRFVARWTAVEVGEWSFGPLAIATTIITGTESHAMLSPAGAAIMPSPHFARCYRTVN